MTVPGNLYTDRIKTSLAGNLWSVLGPDIVNEPLDSVQQIAVLG